MTPSVASEIFKIAIETRVFHDCRGNLSRSMVAMIIEVGIFMAATLTIAAKVCPQLQWKSNYLHGCHGNQKGDHFSKFGHNFVSSNFVTFVLFYRLILFQICYEFPTSLKPNSSKCLKKYLQVDL